MPAGGDTDRVGAAVATHALPTRVYPLLQLREQPGYPPIVPFAGADCAQLNVYAYEPVVTFPAVSVAYTLSVFAALIAMAQV